MRSYSAIVYLSLIPTLLVIPVTAFAYGGPGSVISGIGALLAALAALVASLFGFIWFPLKRLYRRVTKENPSNEGEVTVHQSDE